MKKAELITFLLEVDEFTEKELKKLKLAQLQVLFDERFDIEYEEEDFSSLALGDNNTEFIENIEEEEEVVEVDLNSLSPVERRAYARTGVIPVIRVNKYTRFDDENPKIDN